MNGRHVRQGVAWVLVVSMAGCATTTPYVGRGPHPQIVRGRAVPPIDALGNVLAVIPKILLWNWRVANHSISSDTEAYVARYIDDPQSDVDHTLVRLNQYAPFNDMKRLVKNGNVAWPYRALLGLPITLLVDVLLPGRLFPWGDYYSPWTDTVHLYSDYPAISLHELGHAQDTSERRYKGTYATVRLIPFVDLYQEFQATDEAIRYLVATGDRKTEMRAYKILYPAMGTYAGNYMFIIGGSAIGALVGHAYGRAKAHRRQQYYDRLDAQPSS